MNLHLRWIIKKDLPRLVAFSKGAKYPPRTKKQFNHLLSHSSVQGILIEADTSPALLLGFCIYSFQARYIGGIKYSIRHVRFLNLSETGLQLAVQKPLLEHVMGIGKKTSLPVIAFTRMRESSLEQHLFLRSMGWKAHVSHHAYFDPDNPDDDGESCYVFKWKQL